MGGEESRVDAQLGNDLLLEKPSFSQKSKSDGSLVSQAGRHSIRKTHLQNKWSLLYPNSITPTPREGEFTIYIEEEDCAVIGYGKNGTEVYNDIWMLTFADYKWHHLDFRINTPQPRFGSKAVFVNKLIYVFGGETESGPVSNLHVIDIQNQTIYAPQTQGEGPMPRTGHVMAAYQNKIVIWGGFNETVLDDLWILDTNTMTWTNLTSEIPGRQNAAFAVLGDKLYITCASKNDDMIIFNFTTNTIDAVSTTGSPPPFMLMAANLVAIDRYLILTGGIIENEKYSMVRAYDTVKRWWFVFYLIPDDDTVTVADGGVDSNGIFMIPRIHHGSCVFRPSFRQMILFLGCPLMDPPPISIVDVGEGVAVMHHQLDMLEALGADKFKK